MKMTGKVPLTKGKSFELSEDINHVEECTNAYSIHILSVESKEIIFDSKSGSDEAKFAEENPQNDGTAKEKQRESELVGDTEKQFKTPCSCKQEHLDCKTTCEKTDYINSESNNVRDANVSKNARETPLPLLNWADNRDLWLYMVYKEEANCVTRNPRLFEDCTFSPRSRAILLDWIMEVCEVYHLRRVTYYLSVDYIDRFLSATPNVPKKELQLIGITCLFLASKLEEIYPPKLTEFSYVCDGACTAEQILLCELIVLNTLDWDLNIITPSDWLNLYMQIYFSTDSTTKQWLYSDIHKKFLYPNFSGYQFNRASQLIDLFSLDPGFLKFNYSSIAAAAMYFMYGKSAALSVSALTWDLLQDCAEYMAAFYQVIKNSDDPKLKTSARDPNNEQNLQHIKYPVERQLLNENHIFQTHVVNMDYFEKAVVLRLEQMGIEMKNEVIEITHTRISECEDIIETSASESEAGEEEENNDLQINIF